MLDESKVFENIEKKIAKLFPPRKNERLIIEIGCPEIVDDINRCEDMDDIKEDRIKYKETLKDPQLINLVAKLLDYKEDHLRIRERFNKRWKYLQKILMKGYKEKLGETFLTDLLFFTIIYDSNTKTWASRLFRTFEDNEKTLRDTLNDLIDRKSETKGYVKLKTVNLKQYTFENLVVKYEEEKIFSDSVVNICKKRIN